MAWQSYVTRRNTALFSSAAIISSYFAVKYRQQAVEERQHSEWEKQRKAGNFQVATSRSGMSTFQSRGELLEIRLEAMTTRGD